MRVVLDTNVLLGALISPAGPPDIIYRAWRKARFQLITSFTQLEELRRVSRYPKIRALVPAHQMGSMINQLQRTCQLEALPALPEAVVLADPDDAFLLAMAIAADADYLVTGGRRAGLLQCGSILRTRILTPGDFCAQILG